MEASLRLRDGTKLAPWLVVVDGVAVSIPGVCDAVLADLRETRRGEIDVKVTWASCSRSSATECS